LRKRPRSSGARALDVLRNGIRDSGCKFGLAYFRAASGLNEETRRLHAANLFAVVRQLRYGVRAGAAPSAPAAPPHAEKSLDLVLFLNGIPIFTAELKNPLTGQDVEDAIRQYKTDRDPREPLFAYGRCIAHFAVDPDLVYVTTALGGPGTRFLPFNQGKFGGAGNPPVPPTQKGYATAYLWEQTWARDSVLDLVRQFIHEVEEEDPRGRRIGKRSLIFPRYQQLDCVRRLVADARLRGAGQRYLIQHSAGSGKSFTIAWLAHRLSTLHDTSDRRVFDTLLVHARRDMDWDGKRRPRRRGSLDPRHYTIRNLVDRHVDLGNDPGRQRPADWHGQWLECDGDIDHQYRLDEFRRDSEWKQDDGNVHHEPRKYGRQRHAYRAVETGDTNFRLPMSNAHWSVVR
jgi:hypothetical protein